MVMTVAGQGGAERVAREVDPASYRPFAELMAGSS